MSKSDDAKNRFSEYEEFFNYFARSLADFGKTVETMSSTLENSLKGALEREVPIKNAERMSITEVNKFWAKIEEVLKELGIELGKEGKKFIKHFKDISVSQSKSEQGLSVSNLQNKVSNVAIPQLFIKQMKGLAKGDNDSFIKNFSDNKLAKTIANETVEKLKIGDKFNTFDYKIRAFFGAHFADSKKNLQAFGKNLIEGLVASKFVGGALTDTVKLLGLMGYNWLSDKGPVGQILGKILVVLTQATASILSSSFLSLLGVAIGGKIAGAVGKSFQAGLSGLKNLLSGGKTLLSGGLLAGLFGPRTMTTQMAKSTLSAGTVFIDSATGKLRKVVEGAVKADGTKSLRTIAVKGSTSVAQAGSAMASIGKLGLGALKGAGGLLAGWAIDKGANKAVDMGANAYLAHSLSGISQGAITGAFLGTVIPVLTPVIGAAIGSAVGGIYGLIKGHFVKQEKDQEEKKNFWQELINMIRNSKIGQWLGFGQGGSTESGVTSAVGNVASNVQNGITKFFGKNYETSAQLLRGKTNIKGLLDPKKMSEADWQKADTLEPIYGSMGQILNLGQMSRKRALEVVTADIKAKGNKSFYEKLDSDITAQGSFKTDIPYAARGTSQQFREDMAKLKAMGYNTSSAKITSAIGTLGSREEMSPHKYTGSLQGHFSALADTYDVTALYDANGRRLTQADLKKINKDYYLYNKGAGHATHEHISMGITAWQKASLENLEKLKKDEQKAQAQRHSIEAEAIYATKANSEDYKNMKQSAPSLETDPEGRARLFEKALKSPLYKTEYDKDKNIWVQTKNDGKYRLTIDNADPDGNKDFSDAMINISKIANVGV